MASTAKLFFSDKPFTDSSKGSKESLSSSDFIYGRMELPKSIKDFFKIPDPAKKGAPHPMLFYVVKVWPAKIKAADRQGSGDPSGWPFTKMSAEELENDYWNFDILPEPAKATTITSGTSDFSSGKSTSPMYAMFTRERFPEDGKYSMVITITYPAKDPYDPTIQLPQEKWTQCTEEFTFEFSTQDLPALQENFSNSNKLCQENARLKVMEERGLPEQWNWKTEKIATGQTMEQLTALFMDRESNSCEILKVVVYPVVGPAWNVERDQRSEPIRKWHTQTLGYFSRNNGKYFYNIGSLRQNHEGGGNYSEVFFQREKQLELLPKFLDEAMESKKGAKGKKK